jgi:hypothetical protein
MTLEEFEERLLNTEMRRLGRTMREDEFEVLELAKWAFLGSWKESYRFYLANIRSRRP